jgi:hypothetical protein
MTIQLPLHYMLGKTISWNGLKIMVGDLSFAYLEAFTQEKVGVIAGPEFGPLQGHLLAIDRALYVLRTSGLVGMIA